MGTKDKEKAAPQLATAPNKSTVKVHNKLPYKKSNAVKYLESLANDEAQRKNPTMPVEWLAPRKYRDDTANHLTRCIIDYIRLKNGQAERINSIGRQIDTRCTFADVIGRTKTIGQTKWIKGTGTNGTADVSSVIDGKSVKIEIKIGDDRQSQAQKDYQQSIEKAGGIYVIATSFEQFLAWYKANFELPPGIVEPLKSISNE